MTFDEYQGLAMATATWKTGLLTGIRPDVYCALKLNGEAGEVAEKIGKVYRDNDGNYDPLRLDQIVMEMGDVLWYLAGLCDTLGVSMEDVAQTNLLKLLARRTAGTIHGDGDDR